MKLVEQNPRWGYRRIEGAGAGGRDDPKAVAQHRASNQKSLVETAEDAMHFEDGDAFPSDGIFDGSATSLGYLAAKDREPPTRLREVGIVAGA